MQCNSSPVSGASRKAARARCEEDAPPQVDSLTRPPFGVPWPVLEKRSKRALLRPTERPLYAFEATPLLRYQCSAIHHPCRAPLARLHERGVRRVPSRVHHARAPGDMRRLFAGGLLPRFRVTFTAGVQNHVPKASNELPKALLAVPDQARSRRRLPARWFRCVGVRFGSRSK